MVSCYACGRDQSPNRFCVYCGTPLGERTTRASGPDEGAARGDAPAGAGRHDSTNRGASVEAPRTEPSPSTTAPRRMTPPYATRALRFAPCPHCARSIERALVFCPHCGLRVHDEHETPVQCMVCGEPAGSGAALYCGACGAPMVLGADLTSGTRTPARVGRVDPPMQVATPRLSVLDASGEITRQIPLEREITTIGRSVGDLRLDDDLLDPEHAVVTRGPDRIVVRTVGSSLGNWLFVSGEHRLNDGDLLLLGSQVIRFVKLNPRLTADRGTNVRQVGSRVPENDVAVLEQLLHDGTVRNTHHIADGELVRLGRTEGDWTFPYDSTMSARHAEVRSVSATNHFVVRDLGSRNGVGIAIRGEQVVRAGERLLFGRHMLRVELA